MEELKWPGDTSRAAETAQRLGLNVVSRLVPIFCLALLFGAPSFGFCPEPHASVACEFLNSDAVFTGKVISIRPIKEQGWPTGWYYRLSVLRLFRGPKKKVIEVYTGNDSGRYPLDLGKEYLIFASMAHDANPNKGELTIYNCEDNELLSDAGKLISEAEKIQIPQGGIVEGRVVSRNVGGQGVPGVEVVVNGRDGAHRLATDQQGWFRLEVPHGQYSIDIKSTPARQITAFDLNYGGNPNLFPVDAGKCAGFEFIADPQYKY